MSMTASVPRRVVVARWKSVLDRYGYVRPTLCALCLRVNVVPVEPDISRTRCIECGRWYWFLPPPEYRRAEEFEWDMAV